MNFGLSAIYLRPPRRLSSLPTDPRVNERRQLNWSDPISALARFPNFDFYDGKILPLENPARFREKTAAVWISSIINNRWNSLFGEQGTLGTALEQGRTMDGWIVGLAPCQTCPEKKNTQLDYHHRNPLVCVLNIFLPIICDGFSPSPVSDH